MRIGERDERQLRLGTRAVPVAQENPDPAIGALERQQVLELDPTFHRARDYLQRAYESRGRFGEASSIWQAADTGRALAFAEESAQAYQERDLRG